MTRRTNQGYKYNVQHNYVTTIFNRQATTHTTRRVNVGFMAIRSPAEIDLRVFERGAGETLACGTGACAAVVSGRQRGLLAEKVKVHLPGGDLVICWEGGRSPVWMSGPAAEVFEGNIKL